VFIGGFAEKLNRTFGPLSKRRVMARQATRVPLTFPCVMTAKAFPSLVLFHESGVYKYVFNGQYRAGAAFAIALVGDVRNEHFELARDHYGFTEELVIKLKQKPNRDLVAGIFHMNIDKKTKTMSFKISSISYCFRTPDEYLDGPVEALKKMMRTFACRNVMVTTTQMPDGRRECMVSASLPE
jgi:hypothetical protein